MLTRWLGCITLTIVSTQCLPSAPKSTYGIGGSGPGDIASFEKLWKPLMESYLNAVVGTQYSPPINFTFFGVDFGPTSLLADLYEQGKVDFACEQ